MPLGLTHISELLCQNMTVSDVAKQLQIHRNVVYDILHQNGITDVRSYRINQKFNQKFFEKIDTEEKAYWLGFLFADGNVFIKKAIHRIAINIHKKDVEHISKWHRSIGSCQNITSCGDMVRSIHHSEKMCNDLITLGCVPCKSLVLRFPDLDSSLARHFVRGYFDGDGSIYWHKSKNKKNGGVRLSFVGTDMFLNHLQWEVFFTLGCAYKELQSTGNNKLAFQLMIGGYQEAVKIADWMYADAHIFLDRKHQRYLDFSKRMGI